MCIFCVIWFRTWYIHYLIQCLYIGRMSEAIGVLLRGLPFEADQDDIKQFFSSISISQSNIEMIITYDGKFSGLAFVELHNSDEVKVALLMDRNHMGGRYIDVMTVTEEKLDQIRKAASNGLGRRELHRMCGDNNRPLVGRGGNSRGRGGGASAGNRGLGYGASSRDRSRSPVHADDQNRFAYFNGFPDDVLYKGVRNFFDGCSIGKGCVHLFRGDNGKFRGDGYVEFTDSAELRKGLRKDGMFFRNNRVDVEVCSKQEVLDNLRYMMDRTGPNAYATEPDPLYGGYRRREERDYRRGDSVRGRTRETYHEASGGDRWSGGGYRRREERYENYHHSLDHYEEDRRHNDGYGHQRRHDVYEDREYHHSDRDGYGEHHRGSGGGGSNERRTLRIQGVPSSAKISDIVTFFRNYGVEFEDVRIQCHDDGTPNGRAFVTFPSERISSAAYHDMNRRMLKNAYIELFPV